MDHIQQAHLHITDVLKDADAPVAMVSFGKDSLVLIDLLHHHHVTTVLYLEDDDEVIDRDHIGRIRDRYALDVVRMNRGRGMFFVLKNQPLFLAFPFVSRRHITPVPTNMIPYVEGSTAEFHCVDEMLRAERGIAVALEPDLVFSGFKLSDVAAKGCLTFINLLGADTYRETLTRLALTTELAPGLPLALPLLHWTDAMVWQYLRDHDVPWSQLVYDNEGKRRTADRQWCFRCHDPREASIVHCPKVGHPVLNLAGLADDTDLKVETLVRLGIMTAEQRRDLNHG